MRVDLVIDAIAAGGTVAAVFVALYLSAEAVRKQKALDAKRQRLNALYLKPILEQFRLDLQLISIQTLFEDENPSSMEDVKGRLDRAVKWADSFDKNFSHGVLSAESLSFLPEIVAMRISLALGSLHALKIEISGFNPNGWSKPHMAIAQKSVEWARVQMQARDLIEVSIRDLERQAKPDDVVPSGQELYGGPDDN